MNTCGYVVQRSENGFDARKIFSYICNIDDFRIALNKVVLIEVIYIQNRLELFITLLLFVFHFHNRYSYISRRKCKLNKYSLPFRSLIPRISHNTRHVAR